MSGKSGTALVWFRNNLRVMDNECLHTAWKTHKHVACVYVFDPRHYKKSPFGFPKTGPHRVRFLLESIQDLRCQLETRGGKLIVRRGKPESVLPELVQELKIDTVFAPKEVCSEETRVEDRVRTALNALKVRLQLKWGAVSLVHIDDLPFDPQDLPGNFTQFRKRVEGSWEVRPALSAPDRLNPPSVELKEDDEGNLPTYEELNSKKLPYDTRSVLPFKGGETEAQARVKHYLWDTDCIAEYKETRNGMLGADFSSKFSPWLAFGNVSSRWIYATLKEYERLRTKNKSTYWLVFELLWRDFFRFLGIQQGNRLFFLEGIKNTHKSWGRDPGLIEAWTQGTTGYPLVDANMRELNASGFMSNRGRQIVCSFMSKDMKLDWRIGAEYFEAMLLDHDPCSNWGNWQYGSGVGVDPREDRYFNLASQARNYDSNGDYVRHWCPELENVKGIAAHRPDQLSVNDRNRLQVTYPTPICALLANTGRGKRGGKGGGGRGGKGGGGSRKSGKSWKNSNGGRNIRDAFAQGGSKRSFHVGSAGSSESKTWGQNESKSAKGSSRYGGRGGFCQRY